MFVSARRDELNQLINKLMASEIEIEKTYLAKSLPSDLKSFPGKELLDMYLPKESAHAKLRIRKSGDSYTITKKGRVDEADGTTQVEQNIKLTAEEFASFRNIEANVVHKMRYLYPYKGKTAEIDVFMDKLEGLVLIDVEFGSREEMEEFGMPEFCLAEVTNEDGLAGGMLAGKEYASIESILSKYEYVRVS